MKATNIINITIAILLLFSGVSIAKDWKTDSGKRVQGKQDFRHDNRDYRQGSDNHFAQGHKGNPNYHEHRGYREKPYDRGRHYGHYKQKGHRYEYQGHWRSWEQWDRYAKKHPDIYKQGHYYRESSHLMFRFCDPMSNACFFFSIGR